MLPQASHSRWQEFWPVPPDRAGVTEPSGRSSLTLPVREAFQPMEVQDLFVCQHLHKDLGSWIDLHILDQSTFISGTQPVFGFSRKNVVNQPIRGYPRRNVIIWVLPILFYRQSNLCACKCQTLKEVITFLKRYHLIVAFRE